MSISSTSGTTSAASGGFTNTMRMTGMASGLDVDSIVKQLMDAEKIPYTKLLQKQQLEQWTMDAYRDMSSQIKGFQSTFFDNLTPATNMLSTNNYKQFSNTVTSATGATTPSVSITTNSDASVGSHTINVNALAATAKVSSSSAVGVGEGDYISSTNTVDLTTNNTLNITLGTGTAQTLNLTKKSYDLTKADDQGALISDIQSQLNTAFGAGEIAINLVDEKDATGVDQYRLMLDAVDSTQDITLGTGTANSALGLKDNATIKTVSGSTKLSDLSEKLSLTPSANLNFSIGINNGANNNVFSTDLNIGTSASPGADGGLTIDDLIAKVNSSTAATSAGVVMSFDSYTGKFKFESKATGSTTSINIADSSTLANSNDWLQKIGIASDSSGVTISGKDAVATIDGVTLTNAKNTITQNGVSYNLLSTGTSTVNITTNIDAAVANVKSFIDKYNTLVANINTKLTDKYDNNYPPLTDDQKASMKDADITNWNTKAQTGLLHDDDTLQSVVDQMRSALSAPVPGTSETLHSLGIDTSDDWTQNGKLLMPDDSKLRAALQSDPDGVAKLFTAQSSVSYNPTTNTPDQNQQRYNENGLMYKISDILNDAVRTTNGKGSLLLKAGITNDTTEYSNDIYNEMKQTTTDISDMKAKLTDKENAYYTKFSNLETYMNQMNSQSSWLTQQLSNM